MRFLIAILLGIFISNQDVEARPAGGLSLLTVTNWNNLAVSKCQSMFPSASDCTNTFVTHSTSGLSCQTPIVISTATTLNGGCYQSTTPGTCAIQINDHTDAIIIENLTVVGASASDIICGQNVNVTITNISSFSLDNTAGSTANIRCGTGITCSLTNSRLWGRGIYFSGSSGSIVTTTGNLLFDIQGTGASHAIQLQSGIFSGSSVSNNVVINAPGSSQVNDAINFYDAVGTSGSPITVNANIILGQYSANPNTGSTSGGGIISDGSSSATSGTATQHLVLTNNTVITTQNYGIAFAAGNNNSADNTNVVIKDGLVLGGLESGQITGNVGVYISNFTGQSGSAFNNNTMNGVQVYWLVPTSISSLSATQPSNNSSFTQSPCSPCTTSTISSTYNILTGLGLEGQYINANVGHT